MGMVIFPSNPFFFGVGTQANGHKGDLTFLIASKDWMAMSIVKGNSARELTAP